MSTYVTLRVAGEAYAVPVGYVVEISPSGPVTRVPGTRPEVIGVRNMRGSIVPVVDLAMLLGVTGASARGRLLVAADRGLRAGFEIDQVQTVRELAGPAQDSESALLSGALIADDDLIGVIDVPRLFDELAGAPS